MLRSCSPRLRRRLPEHGQALGTSQCRPEHPSHDRWTPGVLFRDVGFSRVDARPLRTARYSEPFSLLVAQLAYEGEGGPELAYRFERFGEQA